MSAALAKAAASRAKLTSAQSKAKLVRCVAMLAVGDVTIDQIRSRCGVSRRTAYRMIEAIREADVEVTVDYRGAGPTGTGYYSIGG